MKIKKFTEWMNESENNTTFNLRFDGKVTKHNYPSGESYIWNIEIRDYNLIPISKIWEQKKLYKFAKLIEVNKGRGKSLDITILPIDDTDLLNIIKKIKNQLISYSGPSAVEYQTRGIRRPGGNVSIKVVIDKLDLTMY